MSVTYGLCTIPTINAGHLEQIQQEECSCGRILSDEDASPLFSTSFTRGTKRLMGWNLAASQPIFMKELKRHGMNLASLLEEDDKIPYGLGNKETKTRRGQ
ncbi:hypothetical protein SUGI_0604080 [Cryptomeria japonica]|nr:hypothetical protein SUGI_0604080 [Cryptomeria japonica]